MLTAILVMSGLAILLGGGLGIAAIRFRVEDNPLVEKIDAVLPQTQCGQCGFPGCRPYATAIAAGDVDIDRCPPGGEAGIRAIAELLGIDYQPKGDGPAPAKPKAVAFIDESTCIGCTLCLQACPVDAIVGAAKHLHTVVVQDCTGCELCVSPCPVECIAMQPLPQTLASWKWDRPVFQLKVVP